MALLSFISGIRKVWTVWFDWQKGLYQKYSERGMSECILPFRPSGFHCIVIPLLSCLDWGPFPCEQRGSGSERSRCHHCCNRPLPLHGYHDPCLSLSPPPVNMCGRHLSSNLLVTLIVCAFSRQKSNRFYRPTFPCATWVVGPKLVFSCFKLLVTLLDCSGEKILQQYVGNVSVCLNVPGRGVSSQLIFQLLLKMFCLNFSGLTDQKEGNFSSVDVRIVSRQPQQRLQVTGWHCQSSLRILFHWFLFNCR